MFHVDKRRGDGRVSCCKICIKFKSAKYYADNQETVKMLVAAYRASNTKKVKAVIGAWRSSNPEKYKTTRTAWAKANPDKVRISAAAYRAANKEKIKASKAAYRADNKEKIKATNVAWIAANKERKKATNAAWAASNYLRTLEHKRRSEQNRRARKKGAGGRLSRGLSERLYKLQRGKCACCGLPLGNDYHLDHILPLALGGTNADDNIQLLHPACNQLKYAKHPIDFMQERGFLL